MTVSFGFLFVNVGQIRKSGGRIPPSPAFKLVKSLVFGFRVRVVPALEHVHDGPDVPVGR